MRRLAVVATVALLGLAACSSDSSSSATTVANTVVTTEPAAVEETVVEETVVEETVVEETVVEETVVEETVVEETVVDDDTDTTVAGGGEGADTEFCAINQELNDESIPLDGTETAADIEEYFTEFFPEALTRLEGSVPPELAADVATLIEGSTAFGEVLEANDWSLEAAFADPALEAIITNPEFEAAGDRVDEYCEV